LSIDRGGFEHGKRSKTFSDTDHLQTARLTGSEIHMTRQGALIGVPSGAGACGVGQHETPAALRAAGLIERLTDAGMAVTDLGDSPSWPWRPDRDNPRAQNLCAVTEQVRTTSTRVADGLAVPGRIAIVLGGDCTIGIGAVAGARSALGDVGLLYFDLHSDLNTPASSSDGALDWMALAHMLAIPGSEPSLARATGHVQIIDPAQVVLFGHDRAQATGWERNQIKRLDLARFAVEDVAIDPEAKAADALELLARRAERYVIHLDVDVVDFTDAPLSEHTARNTGLPLGVMFRALKVLAAGRGLAAITITELNPKNAAVEDGLLESFAESLAAAIA
jgi:arginase